MASGYMGYHKGATGSIQATAMEAGRAYFAAYPRARECIVSWYRETAPGMVSRDYATQSYRFKRGPKGEPVNALN